MLGGVHAWTIRNWDVNEQNAEAQRRNATRPPPIPDESQRHGDTGEIPAVEERPAHPDLYGDGHTARHIVDRLLAGT